MRLNAPKESTLVALSGGADSVALLRLLLDAGTPLAALHCNFNLRGDESRRDEAFVRALCLRLGVPLTVKQFDTQAYARLRGISIEMAARDLRYQWFEEERQRQDCQWIAVAHHRDDQAETVLLNLLRGAGLQGLAGMRERSGHILRPLLGIPRSELLQYLASIGQDYVTDSTNLARGPLRNSLRLDVVPLLRQLNPKAVEHICRTASLVAEHLDGESRLGYTRHSLHQWLAPLGFTPSQVSQAYEGLGRPPGAVYESPTHRLLRDRNGFVLAPRQDASPPASSRLSHTVVDTAEPMQFLAAATLSPDRAYLDADKLSLPLHERPWQRGDRFRPFGMKGTRLVSDFLTDLKLSRFEKERQTVLLSGGDIVWVVGRRSDDRYRVTPSTRRILCLTLLP